LEKKLVGAYRETVRPQFSNLCSYTQHLFQTAGELLEDGGLFEEEDEEETGALAMYVFLTLISLSKADMLSSGEFADLLGEDYLGLRELGIAAEFGMSNLTIPKRLLKGKKGQNKPTACVFFI
jgi:transcriptional activator SPT7